MKRTLTAGSIAALLLAGAANAGDMKPVTFTVTLKNVSTATTLKLSNGMTAPAPVSPGVFVVHRGRSPLFTVGAKDAGLGLEALAEDGNPAVLAESLMKMKDVGKVGVFSIPVGDREAGPLLPGKTFTFTFDATPGMNLSFAVMFGQSNDLFYAPDVNGIALFDKKGKALTGSVQSQMVLWDAGTEVNQEPGLGADQGPRQKAPNTGAAENGLVRIVKDQFTYPAVAGVFEVTISASRDFAGK